MLKAIITCSLIFLSGCATSTRPEINRPDIMSDIAMQYNVRELAYPRIFISDNVVPKNAKCMAKYPAIFCREKPPLHIIYHEAIHLYQQHYGIALPEYAGCSKPREADAWRRSYEWCKRTGRDCPLNSDDWKIKGNCNANY